MINILTLIVALVAAIVGVLVMAKVNKLITMLRTPIVNKVSADMNLRPSSRRPIGAAEMTSRNNDRNNNRDNRDNRSDRHDRFSKDSRPDRGMNRDRSDRRNSDHRGNRMDHRRPDFASAASNSIGNEKSAISAESPVEFAPAATSPEPVEGRRPLAPRVQASVPQAPVESSPVPSFAAAESSAEAVPTVGADFDPSKVRYGRRNFVKKLPEIDEASAPSEPNV
ncbi:MAG: hypothetical protein M0P13_00535 [Fibrobacteraceae bacterium]|nr:hypothetical protein [Fibrobacteraceae bacterium]